jgi:hypothetical protein
MRKVKKNCVWLGPPLPILILLPSAPGRCGARATDSLNFESEYATPLRFRRRKDVALALANAVDDIDYPNFKDSVEDDWLHYAYLKVWLAMAELQHAPPYTPASKYIAG